MSRKPTVIAIALSLLALPALAPPAAAAPSLLHGGSTTPNFLGASGLLLTPSAYTVGDRGVSGHAYFTENFNSYGLLVGPFDRLEVGFTVLDFDREAGDGTEVLANAKFTLLKEGLVWPAVSVGVIDAFDELSDDPSWYLVASKGLPRVLPVLGGLTVHAGYGGGLYDDELFAGLELKIGTPLDLIPVSKPTFTFLAEYANDDVNLGLRGRWKGFAATLALFDFDEFGGGISYTTGLRLW